MQAIVQRDLAIRQKRRQQGGITEPQVFVPRESTKYVEDVLHRQRQPRLKNKQEPRVWPLSMAFALLDRV